MPHTNALPADRSESEGLKLRVLNPALKGIWAVAVAITVLVEVIPIPLMPPPEFYAYCAAKFICFVAVGFLAPLAFWRFNALNRGILFAAVSATCVEALQGLLQGGHSFHWYELLIKLALILIGFALALDARYERCITLGPINLRLVGNHLDS